MNLLPSSLYIVSGILNLSPGGFTNSVEESLKIKATEAFLWENAIPDTIEINKSSLNNYLGISNTDLGFTITFQLFSSDPRIELTKEKQYAEIKRHLHNVLNISL